MSVWEGRVERVCGWVGWSVSVGGCGWVWEWSGTCGWCIRMSVSTVRTPTEINLFWAAHQVHHSSEEVNLSTALRQSTTQPLTSWVRVAGGAVRLGE